MAKRDRNNGIGTAAILVGGGLLLWLLLRGKRWGLGGSGDGDGGTGESGAGTGAIATSPREPVWCNVRVDSNGISLKGEVVDVPTVVARCGAARGAFLRVTGGAKHGDYLDVVDALRLAGLQVDVVQQITEDRSTSRTFTPVKQADLEKEISVLGSGRYLLW